MFYPDRPYVREDVIPADNQRRHTPTTPVTIPIAAQFLARLLSIPPILRLVMSLWGLFVLVCAVMIALGTGRSIPGSIFDSDLIQCGEVICFRGLIPGGSSWSDAMRTFNNRWLITDDPSYGGIAIYPNQDVSKLEKIVLHMPFATDLTLGMIIKRYGKPTCIEIFHRTGTLSLHYPQFHVLSRFRDNRINAFSKVASIVLVSGVESSSCPTIISIRARRGMSHHSWHGFATMQHYGITST